MWSGWFLHSRQWVEAQGTRVDGIIHGGTGVAKQVIKVEGRFNIGHRAIVKDAFAGVADKIANR